MTARTNFTPRTSSLASANLPEPPCVPDSPDSDRDEVDEASEESFPASDPPSWDPLHSGAPTPSVAKPNAHETPENR